MTSTPFSSSLLSSSGFTYAFLPGYIYVATFHPEETRTSRLSVLPANSWPPPHLFTHRSPLPPPRSHRLYRLPYILPTDDLPDPPPASPTGPLCTDPALLRLSDSPSPSHLPQPRAIILSPIPPVSLATILTSVRGGKIERISHGGGKISIFFVRASAAAAYASYVNEHGGIPWKEWPRTTSWASFIPVSQGAAEPIRPSVGAAMRREGAGRVLVARGLPETVGEGVVREVVSRWAGKVRPVFEGVEVAEGVLVLRMGSIGTALKARDTVVNVWGARTEWGVDECEGSLEGLREVWEEIRKENGAKEKGRRKVVMRGWVGSFGR